MTKEEAINQLGWLKCKTNEEKKLEAVDMAIEALENERPKGHWILSRSQDKEDTDNGNYRFECSNCRCSDTHSKATEVPYCWHCGADMRATYESNIRKAMRAMTREEIIRKAMRAMTREEIIMEVEKIRERGYVDSTVQSQHALDMAIEALKEEPKSKVIAQIHVDTDELLERVKQDYDLVRPKGHWLDRDGEPTDNQYAVYCSECTNWSEYASDFCMNCGADMRGESDD